MTLLTHRALAAALTLMSLLAGATAGEPPPVVLQDRAARDFQAETLAGHSLQLSSLQGKVVLLNFWGIWCIPCRKEVPELQKMYEELRDRGLQIVGIEVGDEIETARKYVAQQALSYPIILSETIAADYDIEVFPTNVIIDRAGRIRHREEGYDDGTTQLLRGIIEQLLGQESSEAGDKP